MELNRREQEMILVALRNEARTLKHMDDDLVRRDIIDIIVRKQINDKLVEVSKLAEKIASSLGQELGNLYLG